MLRLMSEVEAIHVHCVMNAFMNSFGSASQAFTLILLMVEGGGYYQNHSTRMHLIVDMGESMKRSNSKAAQEAQAKYCYLISVLLCWCCVSV